MPRGVPDGGFQPYANAGNMSDLGQMVNSLWGFQPLDGMGRVNFLDTFNNGLGAWFSFASGAGSAPAVLTRSLVFSPPNAALLTCGTTGPVGNGESVIQRDIVLKTPSRTGIESALSWDVNTPVWELEMTYQFSPTQYYLASLRFRRSTLFWAISLGAVGSYWGLFADVNPTAVENPYQQVKLVVDFTTGKYVRAIIGQNSVDLSAYAMPIGTFSAAQGLMEYMVICWSEGVAGQTAGRVGYVLATRDEP